MVQWSKCFVMTMRVTNTPLMMQDNFMYHLNQYNLWVSLLRRKFKMTQKTKKNLRQCSHCWSYTVFN